MRLNKKRIVGIFFWIALSAYLIVSMGFVAERRHNLMCTSVEVSVVDSLRSRFVTVSDIAQMVDNRNRLKGKLFDSIRTKNLEQYLNTYAPIHRAEIYKTINGKVHVDVEQRAPALRIINRYGENYYIDEQGEALKHSRRYSTHILVANGYINQHAPEGKGFNVFKIETEEGRRCIIRELYELAQYINHDKFWRAQIQQIYVNADGDFELIPRVGAHIINFGSFERADSKFSNLKSLYINGLNVKGWNSYEEINLKYEGQIVCTQK